MGKSLTRHKAFHLGFISRVLSCILACATCGEALSAPMAETFNDFKATKIEIRGNRRIEKDAIIEKMKIREGATVTEANLRSDLLAIFGMGFFENLRFEREESKLVLIVRERPVVVKISYEGSDEFEKKDLDEASGLKPFNVLNLSKIREARSTLAKKYEEKGYYLARVDHELRPIEKRETEVELVLKITENERVRVRRIFFLGNKVITSGDLKKVMATAEGHVFSWATQGGTYREAVFDRDLALLAFYYGNEGYIEAKFQKPRVTLSQDRRYIDIVINVEEGKKFFLGDVKFAGDDLFSQDELRRSFDMKEGDVFSTGKLQEEVLKLTDKYGDLGYAYANVIPKTMVRQGTSIVDLSFDIERGEKVYWGKITITGNSKTHDKVIRRELPFNEGELYNATKRKKGLDHVRRLGFFGNDVNFLTSTPKGSTNVMDVEIKVQEKPTGSLNASLGYGSGSGFQFGGQIGQQNLFGLGQQLGFDTSLNKDSKTFNLNFTDPKVFDSEWLAGFSLYLQQNAVGAEPKTYDQRLTGGTVRLGREVAEDLNLYTLYKLEHYYLKDPVSDAIFTSPKDKESFISSVTGTVTYDTRNNRIDPSKGIYLSGSGEFAGIGGRVFQKFLASARLYQKVFWKVVYRTNLEGGLLTNFVTRETVPDTERFLLGGIFSIRGYPWTSIGPARTVTPTRKGELPNAFPYVIGGTKKVVFNQEIEFPLIPEADIRLAAFFDVGNAWDNGFGKLSPALLAGYGWGIRWYSPLGPLRFEWGIPLTTTTFKKDRSSEFYFVIAPTF